MHFCCLYFLSSLLFFLSFSFLFFHFHFLLSFFFFFPSFFLSFFFPSFLPSSLILSSSILLILVLILASSCSSNTHAYFLSGFLVSNLISRNGNYLFGISLETVIIRGSRRGRGRGRKRIAVSRKTRSAIRLASFIFAYSPLRPHVCLFSFSSCESARTCRKMAKRPRQEVSGYWLQGANKISVTICFFTELEL